MHFILGVLFFVLFLTSLIFIYIHQLKIEYKKVQLALSKIHVSLKEKDEIQKSLVNELHKDQDRNNKGTQLFNLAMALDTFEPSKFTLLEKASAAGNYYAGIYLGNIYQSGLKKGDAIIINKDNQKAYSYYEAASKKDPYGIAFWRMGWAYERGHVGTEMKTEDREKMAFQFYERSRDMQYAKAYNSIGKFYNQGRGGLRKNQFDAIEQYGKAEELGDHFATLNKAMILAKMENYDEAEEFFKKAIITNSPGAYTAFASFIQSNREHFKTYSDEMILDLYSQAALIKNSNVAAKAFYEIADFICGHPNVINKDSLSIKLFGTIEEEFILSCRLKAYEILLNNLKAGIRFTPRDFEFSIKIAKALGKNIE